MIHLSLSQNTYTENPAYIFLYSIAGNILANNGWQDNGDWLDEKEFSKFEKSKETDLENWIDQNIEGGYFGRMNNILIHYLSEDGLNWKWIEQQIDDYLRQA